MSEARKLLRAIVEELDNGRANLDSVDDAASAYVYAIIDVSNSIERALARVLSEASNA